jgi:hypothetical protein
MSDTPELSICIVSWNVRELLLVCLRSLTKIEIPYEVIVVDNGSHDGSVDAVKREFPQVKLTANPQNYGFAVANNQAIHQATAPWVVLLNCDSELVDDPFNVLIAVAKTDDQIACVAPELIYPDGRHQRSVRHFPKLSDQAVVLLKLRQLLAWTPVMKKYMTEPDLTNRLPIDVDQVMGACMLIRRTALQQVGLLDEGYPNWFEEVDWCKRAKQADWRIVYVPTAQVIHHGGSSFNQVLSLKKHRWLLIGLKRYAHKFWPSWQQPVVKALAAISYGLTIFQTLFKPR